jgi:hypothetical protein
MLYGLPANEERARRREYSRLGSQSGKRVSLAAAREPERQCQRVVGTDGAGLPECSQARTVTRWMIANRTIKAGRTSRLASDPVVPPVSSGEPLTVAESKLAGDLLPLL